MSDKQRMFEIYKKAVLNDLILQGISNTDAQELMEKYYDKLIDTWGYELNSEHLADEIINFNNIMLYNANYEFKLNDKSDIVIQRIEYIFIVIGCGDKEYQNLYVGLNKQKAIETYRKATDSTDLNFALIEVWANDIQLEKDWEPNDFEYNIIHAL